MQEAGLLARESSPEDRRVVYLCLTAEAEQRVEACVRELGPERTHLSQLLRTLS